MSEYRFYLYHVDLGKWTRIPEPKGWDSMQRTRKRFGVDTNVGSPWHGMFYEFTTKLSFIKLGKKIIQDLRELYGPETEILLKIEKKDARTHRFNTDYEGRLNLYSYRNKTVEVSVNVEQTGFTQKVKNGNDIKVNVEATETQDGGVMPAAPMITLPLHSKALIKEELLIIDGEGATRTLYGGSNAVYGDKYFQVSYTSVKSEIDVSEIYPDGESSLIPEDNEKYNLKLDKFNVGDTTFQFDYKVKIRARTTGVVGSDAIEAYFYVIHKRGGSIINTITEVLVPLTVFPFGTWFDSGFITFTVNYTAATLESDEIYYYFKVRHINGQPDTEQEVIFDLTAENKVSTSVVSLTAPSDCQAMMIHEAMQRTVHSLTGKSNSFYSEHFGRTDLGYDEDGAGSLRAITSVNKIRGIDKPLKCTLSGLINTAWALDAIGVGIEKVNGAERIRVEPLSFWYQAKPMMRLDYVLDIEKGEVAELYCNQAEGGIDKWGNEQIANLDEPNSKKEWTFPISQIKQKLDLKSPYITGAYTIEFARRERAQPTKDTKADEENVIIRVLRDGDDFVPEKDEAFSSVTGIISPETSYNLQDSPARCFRRHGRLLRSFLNYQQDLSIKFQAGEANNNMVSQLTTEATPITESADIPIADLERPIFLAETYQFRAKLTYDQLLALNETDSDADENVLGYIEFSKTARDHKRGYVLGAQLGADSNEVIFELLKANV
jgi:hypothetical protein